MTIFSALLLPAALTAVPIDVTPLKVLDGLRPVALAAAPTGSMFVATMEDGTVRIIDANTRQTIRTLSKHKEPAYGVAWSPDGEMIATGDETARIYLESTKTGKLLRQYRTHTRGIEKLSFNSTDNLLISTGKDDAIKVYDLKSPRPMEQRTILGKGCNLYGATCCPTLPNMFLTGDLTEGGYFYDAKTAKVAGLVTAHGNQGVNDVAFNRAGSRYATAGRDGVAILWDGKTHKKIGGFKGHSDWVTAVAFSPNGTLLATSSVDGTVKVWNTYSMQKVADLKEQTNIGSPLCFTADGKTLVTVSAAGSLEFNKISPKQAS